LDDSLEFPGSENTVFSRSVWLHLCTYLFPVEGKAKERWLELCEQAAVEQDRDKLLQLMREISRLLEEKEERLAKLRSAKQFPSS
jgi:hypothetical protein